MRTAEAAAPTIWSPEAANAARCPAVLDVRLDAPVLSRALRETRSLAKGHGLSPYDAAYLELAMRQSLPLATLDERLTKAARKVGVPLLEG